MNITFSLPRTCLDRLARLCLACADDATNISHIGVRVGPSSVRFSATNGRLLASLVVLVDDFQGMPTDLILDREQFASALKLSVKATGRITCTINNDEARFSSGTVASVVRHISGSFPGVDHVWQRPSGRRWVPTMSSIDPQLAAIAQRIIGMKKAVLFSSPVDPGMRLERLWASPGREDYAESISLDALRSVVTAPAYWADYELAILLMPITRSDAEGQLDLSAHASALSQAAAIAA